MIPVPTDQPVYCIDAYEVTVADGMATSIAGVTPSKGVTYDDAVAACAATPVTDNSGATVGFRHMATSSEWEDAADGVVGEGGTRFPYGDTWIDGACATPNSDGYQPITEMQPTGSFPDCVSAFGTYDQVGNLHEWMDSGLTVDAARAVTRFAEFGVALSVGAAGELYADGDVSALLLQVVTVTQGTVSVRDRRLYIAASAVSWNGSAQGYLAGKYDLPSEGWYPIQLQPIDDGSGYWIDAMLENDSKPIPDKRGCAYYAGWDSGCVVDQPSYFHTHDFRGTVGFRCATAPFVP